MTSENSAVIRKTCELCTAIIEQPQFESIQRRMEAFEDDLEAQRLYRAVVEEGERLSERQRMGETLAPEEITAFETHRAQLLQNRFAQGYMAAQEEMHQVQVLVRKYVTKTFELGRLPTAEDFASTCRADCSCNH